jgi:hypothetical protein
MRGPPHGRVRDVAERVTRAGGDHPVVARAQPERAVAGVDDQLTVEHEEAVLVAVDVRGDRPAGIELADREARMDGPGRLLVHDEGSPEAGRGCAHRDGEVQLAVLRTR